MTQSNRPVDMFSRTFLTEADELIQLAKESLSSIDASGAGPETVASLLRSFHTLKGSAALFGLENIILTAHALEDALTAARDRVLELDAEWIQVIWRGNRLLALAVDQFRQNPVPTKPGPEEEAMAAEIIKKIQMSSGAAIKPASIRASDNVRYFCGSQDVSRWVFALKASFNRDPNSGEGSLPGECLETARALTEACQRADLTEAVAIGERFVGDYQNLAQDDGTLPEAASDYLRATFKEWIGQLKQIALPPVQRAATPEGLSRDQALASTFRMDEKELDQAVSVFGKLLQQKQRLQELADRLQQSAVERELSEELQDIMSQQTFLVSVLSKIFLKIKRTPMGIIFEKIKALVQSMRSPSVSAVDIQLKGQEVLIDRKKVDVIHGILVHFVRNSLAHGIEPAQERLAAGKPASGRIEIEAREDGDSVTLRYADDGRGIDIESMRQLALKKGHSWPASISFETPQPAKLLFGSGASTSREVTDLSGRGVGMESVMHDIKKMGGVLLVSSVWKKNTVFEIKFLNAAHDKKIKPL